MTTPTPEAFEYTDDSVVAKVSVDVPAQSLTDISQLTSAMSSMRVEMEAMARSQGDWLEYLRQMPVIVEQTNQALRDHITQLERVSYINNEIGGGSGNVGFNTLAASGGGGGGGGYSTAAPSGYVNPFAGGTPGMGVGYNPGITSSWMNNMASQDPRMYANMMAARGGAVNPALLGQMGGAVGGYTGMGGVGGVGGGMGWGNAAPGSMSPQSTQSSRDSAAPPVNTQSGQQSTSEPQNIPSDPHPDSPEWQKSTKDVVNNILSEMSSNRGSPGGITGGVIRTLGGIAGAAGKGGVVDAIGGRMGMQPGTLGKIGGMAGKIGGLAGGAWLANKFIQDTGEKITDYSQLGSIQGGGVMEGAGYEAQARIMGMNPFITTDQARQVMQMAMREGFRGGNFDTVQGFMIKNFKDMGMSFAEQMDLINASVVKTGDSGKSFSENMQSLQDSLELMKGLAKQGGGSLPERNKQFESTMDTMGKLNVPMEAAKRASLGFQEMFKDNKVLRDASDQIANQSLSSPVFLTQMAQRNGITGLMPGAIPGALADAGVDLDKAFLEQAREVARQVSSIPGGTRGQAAAFQSLMSQYGIELDQAQAYQLYKELTGGRDIEGDTDKSIAGGATKRTVGDRLWSAVKTLAMPVFDVATANPGDIPKDAAENFNGAFGGVVEGSPAQRAANDYANNSDTRSPRSVDPFAPSGQPPRTPPRDAAEMPTPVINTSGVVTGSLVITVDQQGRVVAPQSIQLSGQQKAANAGFSSATLNNAPPGDPIHDHSYTAFGGR